MGGEAKGIRRNSSNSSWSEMGKRDLHGSARVVQKLENGNSSPPPPFAGMAGHYHHHHRHTSGSALGTPILHFSLLLMTSQLKQGLPHEDNSGVHLNMPLQFSGHYHLFVRQAYIICGYVKVVTLLLEDFRQLWREQTNAFYVDLLLRPD